MMKRLFTLCLIGGSMVSLLSGQILTSPFWRPASESDITNQSSRQIVPSSYQVWSLDEMGMTGHLAQTPVERNVTGATQAVALPDPNGNLQRFALVKVPVMDPALAAKYPGNETYAGIGIDNPHLRVRMDMTRHGFHAWVMGGGLNYYIDPYSQAAEAEGMYLVYHTADQPEDPNAVLGCGAEDHRHDHDHDHDAERATFSYGEDLLTYRLAVTTAAPYTIFHGGTKADALSAVTTVVNRVNMMYESEFSIRMVLIAGTDTLFFTDLASNPFTQDPTALGSTLPVNQTLIDARIGSANYDVGHLFSRAVLQPGGGSYTAGIASLSSVCDNNRKARGASATPTPIGGGFEGIVMHEFGHQYGANHGFNSDNASCGPQRAGGWAFQPGGGTTIMCYPGVCGNHDVQGSRDFYFHTGSHEQIFNNTRSGIGSNCGVVTPTGNQPPTVDGGNHPDYIPVGTAFKLTGDGSDPDGDPITFVWEEIDLGPAGHPNFPVSTAPLFRTFNPTDSAKRVFPQWTAQFVGQQIIGEILPAYERPLNFRLTARDGKGGIGNAEINIDVTETAGPFQVTNPNLTNQHQWEGGSYQIVTWDVAGTDGGLFNVDKVNIRLDIDNDPNFPYLLAENTPNDGHEIVLVPDVATASGRVMVEAVDHIFFDISDQPIPLLLPAQPSFSMFFPVDNLELCLGDSVSFDVYTASQQGFQESIDFFAIGIPFGMQVSSEPATVGDT
ncbi:MAG: reprolysin-like metallopeptidase, partial [Bacteroidota bacterium]